MEDNKKKSSESAEVRKCKTCKITFDSISDYADHLESQQHIKSVMKLKYGEKYLKAKLKLEQKNAENDDAERDDDNPGDASESTDSEADVYPCEVCKKVCTGKLSYKLHINGKNHKKMLKKIKMVGKMKDTMKTHQQAAPMKDDKILENLFSTKNYASSDIICETCNKRFSGPENYKQHMASETHRKKQDMRYLAKEMTDFAFAEGKSSDKYFECDICKKRLSSPDEYKQHLASNKHLKMKQSAVAMSQLEGTFESEDELKCEICNKQFSGFIPLKMHLDSLIHKKQEIKKEKFEKLAANFPEIEISTNDNSEDSDEDVHIMCSICHVPFSGPEAALVHVSSQKHKKAAKCRRKLKKKDISIIANNASSAEKKHPDSNGSDLDEEFEVISLAVTQMRT